MNDIADGAMVIAVAFAALFLLSVFFKAAKWLVKVTMFLAILFALMFLIMHIRG